MMTVREFLEKRAWKERAAYGLAGGTLGAIGGAATGSAVSDNPRAGLIGGLAGGAAGATGGALGAKRISKWLAEGKKVTEKATEKATDTASKTTAPPKQQGGQQQGGQQQGGQQPKKKKGGQQPPTSTQAKATPPSNQAPASPPSSSPPPASSSSAGSPTSSAPATAGTGSGNWLQKKEAPYAPTNRQEAQARNIRGKARHKQRGSGVKNVAASPLAASTAPTGGKTVKSSSPSYSALRAELARSSALMKQAAVELRQKEQALYQRDLRDYCVKVASVMEEKGLRPPWAHTKEAAVQHLMKMPYQDLRVTAEAVKMSAAQSPFGSLDGGYGAHDSNVKAPNPKYVRGDSAFEQFVLGVVD